MNAVSVSRIIISSSVSVDEGGPKLVSFSVVKSRIPQRCVLTLLTFMAIISLYMMRICLPISMTQMVKSIASNTTAGAHELICPDGRINESGESTDDGTQVSNFCKRSIVSPVGLNGIEWTTWTACCQMMLLVNPPMNSCLFRWNIYNLNGRKSCRVSSCLHFTPATWPCTSLPVY